MAYSRADLEAEMAEALSRHIGYTTGAYQIERIASITLLFERKPSLYKIELLQHLTSPSIGESYAKEIINFAVALRLIQKVSDGPARAASRFALTPKGATIKSALQHGDDDLIRFTLTGLVLEADCDAYGLLLDILETETISGATLHHVFRDRTEELRRNRYCWLSGAFPNQLLRERIYARTAWVPMPRKATTWLREPRIRLSDDFGRHHVTPRLGWAHWFGHIGSSPKGDGIPLTRSGLDIVHALRASSTRYVWLGPPADTQTALGIAEPHQLPGPYAPAWNVLRPEGVRDSPVAIQRLADEAIEFMETHYDALRLIHANQASVESMIPYLHLKEQQLGYSVQDEAVLERIFEARSPFNLLSARSGRFGYFQRKSSES